MFKRKEKKEVDPLGDDLDDLDFGLDDFDIGADEGDDNRSPLRKLSISFADGAKDDLTDRNNLVKAAKKALPKSFETTIDTVLETKESMNDMLSDVRQETKRGVRHVKKATKRVVGPHEEKLPKWLKDRLEKVLAVDDDEEKRIDATQSGLDEAKIQQALGSIFTLQAERDQRREKEEEVKTISRQIIEDKRYQTDLSNLQAIRTGIEKQVSYQQQVTAKYYQKSIELQYRSYFAQRDLLTIQEKSAHDIKEALSGIVKNTSLPEYRKLQLTENVGQQLRDSFTGDLAGNMSKMTKDALSGVLGRLNEAVKKRANAWGANLEDLSGGIDSFSGGDDTGVSPLVLAGRLGGTFVANKAVEKLVPIIRKQLEDRGILTEQGENAQQFNDNLPLLINEYLEKNQGQGGVKGFLSEIIGHKTISSSMKHTGIEDSESPAIFDKLTRQSIVEIIPGYLSRIHLELKTMRQGFGHADPNERDRITFDIKTRDFSTKGKMGSRLQSELVGKSDVDATNERLEEIFKSLDINDHLDPDLLDNVKSAFFRFVLKNRFQGRLLTFDKLADPTNLTPYTDYETAAAFSQALVDRYEGEVDFDHNGETVFRFNRSEENSKNLRNMQHLSNRITDTVADPKNIAQGYLDTGNESALRESGLVKLDEKGNPVFDYDAYYAMIVNGVSPPLPDTGGTSSGGRPPLIGPTPSGRSPRPDSPSGGEIQIREPSADEQKSIRERVLRSLFGVSDQEPGEGGPFKKITDILQAREEGIGQDIRELKDKEAGDATVNRDDAQVAILSRILQTVEVLGTTLVRDDPEGQGLFSRVIGGSQKVLGKLISGYVGIFSGGFKLAGGAMGGAGSILSGVGKRIGSMLSGKVKLDEPRDVYIRNQLDSPLLVAAKMRAGEYFDRVTGKPILSLEDLRTIKGDIVDKSGEVVATLDMLKKGVVDYANRKIDLKGVGKSILNRATGFASKAMGVMFAPTRMLLSAPKKVFDVASSLISRPIDVYVKGESQPRLLAIVMKNNGYVSAKTGQPIRSLKDVDGAILDLQGNVVLSLDDMRRGLTNRFGEPLGFFKRQLSRIFKLAKLPFSIAKKGFTIAKNVVSSGVGGTLDFIKQKLGIGEGGESKPPVDKTQFSDFATRHFKTLDEIIQSIKSLKPKIGKWDSDGDGDRDNSWRDQMSQEEDGDEEKEVDVERDKKDGSILSTLKKFAMPVILMLGGLAKMMYNKVMGVFDFIKDLFEMWLGKKMFDFMRRGGGPGGGNNQNNRNDRGDRNDRGNRNDRGDRSGRPRSWIRRAGSNLWLGAKYLGKQSWRAAKWAAPKLVQLGARAAPWVMRGILMTGSTAAAILTSPITLAVGAVVAVGVAGYYTWKYFKGKKQGPFNEHRLLQYGLQPDQEDERAKVLMLEKALEGNITRTEDGKFEANDNVDFPALQKEMGVDVEDPDALTRYLTWLNGRFLPVFWANTQALESVDPTKSLFDSSSLPVKKRLAFFDKSCQVNSFSDEIPHPYAIFDSPFSASKLTVTRKQIKASEEEIRKGLVRKEQAAHEPGGAGDAVLGDTVNDDSPGVKTVATALEGSTFYRTRGSIKAQSTIAGINPNRRHRDDLGRIQDADKETVIRVRSTLADLKMGRGEKSSQVTPLTALMFKVMGLKTLDQASIDVLSDMCDRVLLDAKYMADGNAEWEGELQVMFYRYHPRFDIKWFNLERKNDWKRWFEHRFLPVYLGYLTAIRQNYSIPGVALDALKNYPRLQYEVGRALTALTVDQKGEPVSVWELEASPWEEPINTDATSVEEYIEVLRVESIKKDSIDEGDYVLDLDKKLPSVEESRKHKREKERKERFRKKGESAANASTDSGNARGTGAGTGTGAKEPSVEDKVNLILNEALNGGSSGGVGGGGGGLGSGSPVSGGGDGRDFIHPGGGTGGDINDLPQSNGDGSWDAHKELIVKASLMAGVDPGIMATMAAIESNFRAKVKASTSSATGLYQFIGSTWKEMLRKYGSKYGISQNASRIDPRANALMGAEFLKENARALKGHVSGTVTDAHLYAAHFLGAGGARKLFSAPANANATSVIGRSASNANRPIFYEGSRQRTVAEVFKELQRRVSTRSDKYAEEARTLAKQYGGGTSLGQGDSVSDIIEQDTSSQTSEFSPVTQPTQTLVDEILTGPSSNTGVDSGSGLVGGDSGANSPATPQYSPINPTNNSANTGVGLAGESSVSGSISPPSTATAGGLEVLKNRVAGTHVDVNHLDRNMIPRLAGFIQEVEQVMGDKVVVNSAFRPPGNAEKKALGSPGTTQASLSGSSLAASKYGSMHTRGEAVDLKLSKAGSFSGMNGMSSKNKQIWFQLARKHGLNLPLLAGAMGPGTGRKGSNYVEWWHLEPMQPNKGKRGDLGLRGDDYAQYIKGIAASGGSGSGYTPDNNYGAGGSVEESSSSVQNQLDGGGGGGGIDLSGSSTASLHSQISQMMSGKQPTADSVTGTSTGSTGSSDPSNPWNFNYKGATSTSSTAPRTGSLLRQALGIGTGGIFGGITGAVNDVADGVSDSINDITGGLSDVFSGSPPSFTPRSTLFRNTGIDNSSGLNNAFHHDPTAASEQRQQQKAWAATKSVEDQKQQRQGTESLCSIQRVLERSLSTQQMMDSHLKDLLDFVRGNEDADKKDKGSFSKEQPRVAESSFRQKPKRQQEYFRPGSIDLSRKTS